ncbi:MAG TPA: glycerophosphodiester phosphodiesterase [Gemmatimonadales bacterium]|nr:glycerophosphodiester phosphodiesterase [Gemmatimonadales bacterium]
MSRPLVIAHRGASALEYENSLAAFRLAGRLGADGVELDIHATGDGALVVHHDDTIGGVHIPTATAEAVRAQRLPNGEAPPLLEEALRAIDPRLRVYVEVKTLPPACDAHLIDVLDAGPHPTGYAVHAFDHRLLARLGALRPSLPRGVLSASYPIRPLIPLVDAGAVGFWMDRALVDGELAALLHIAGAQLIAWTVDDAAEMVRLAGLGVDALCTNRPDLGRRTMDTLRP